MAQDPAHLDDPRKTRALEGMRAHGTLSAAARFAGVSRSTVYDWREADPAFAEALHQADEEHRDDAEEELHKRAVLGDEQIVYYKGEPVVKRDPQTGDPLLDENFEVQYYTRVVKSDQLLPVYLKAKRPAYRDKTDLTLLGPDGGPVKTDNRVEIVLVDPVHGSEEPAEPVGTKPGPEG